MHGPASYVLDAKPVRCEEIFHASVHVALQDPRDLRREPHSKPEVRHVPRHPGRVFRLGERDDIDQLEAAIVREGRVVLAAVKATGRDTGSAPRDDGGGDGSIGKECVSDDLREIFGGGLYVQARELDAQHKPNFSPRGGGVGRRR